MKERINQNFISNQGCGSRSAFIFPPGSGSRRGKFEGKTEKVQGKRKKIVILLQIRTKCGQNPLFKSVEQSALHKVIC